MRSAPSLACSSRVESIGEDVHRTVVSFVYLMQHLRAVLSCGVADAVVAVHLEHIEVAVHLCHPATVGILHLADAGAVARSRLVEVGLHHGGEEGAVAVVYV